MAEYRIRQTGLKKFEIQRNKFSGWVTEATEDSLAGCVRTLRRIKEEEIQKIVNEWAEDA